MLIFGTGIFYFFWKVVKAHHRETMAVLSEKQLKRLAEHKYSRTGDLSLMEPWFAKFWEWCVQQIPLWWAPNCLTFAGLVLNVVTSLIIIVCYNEGKHAVSAWVYIFGAVGLFAYQVLDSIDGKQARRTQSSTPLGELFDHGCDAISTVFVALSFCLTIQYADIPYTLFFISFFMMFLFYLAHWQTYVTGSLRFGKLDVTEAQWLVIASFITTAICGPSFWYWELPLIGVTPQSAITVVMITGGILQVYSNFRIIFMQGGIGRNGSTVAGSSVIFPIFPIVTVIACAVAIANKSHDIYENNPCLYILAFGMMFAKITMRVIVSHMTKSELDYFDSVYFGFGMLLINQYFDIVIAEYYVLWAALLYSVVNVLMYSHAVSQQICDYLNIYCFCITRRPRARDSNGSTAAAASSSSAHANSRVRGDSSSSAGSAHANGRPKKDS